MKYLIFLKNGSGKYTSNASIPIVIDCDEKVTDKIFTTQFVRLFVYAFLVSGQIKKPLSCCSHAPSGSNFCPTCGGRISSIKNSFLLDINDRIAETWDNIFQGNCADNFPHEIWDYLDQNGFQFYIEETDTFDKIIKIDGIDLAFRDTDHMCKLISKTLEAIEKEEQQKEDV